MCPSKETPVVRYCSGDGTAMFMLTKRDDSGYFYLYKISRDGQTKLGKAKTPKELEKKFEVDKAIKEGTSK